MSKFEVSTLGGSVGVIDHIAEVSVVTLKNTSVLGRLVFREVENDFQAGVGATVNVRKPSIFTSKNLAKDADVSNSKLDEKLIPVTLDTHAYVSTLTNTWDETVNLENVARQITLPQAEAVAVGDTDSIEARIAAELKKVISAKGTDVKDAEGKNVPKAIEHKKGESFRDTLVKLDAHMNSKKVPLVGRRLVVSPEFRSEILMDDLFVKADSYGNPNLIQGGGDNVDANHMGNFLGFDVYLSTMVDGMTAFTREAFALALRVPVPMEGAVSSSVIDRDSGFGMRLTKAAAPSKLATQVSTDVLVGAAILDADRCIGVKLVTA
ncbi:P22 phage major capsid protein family protein [Streptomyces sp. MBT27]|uniref:P22 phage major capsid protein family protein n=1 Tax=Streptomyces sp. MBT27 TaxID=1488356 RepID=UPI0014213DFB|nr:P22 phage major capsid protein family protein [Streptomyces sp. MBT27]